MTNHITPELTQGKGDTTDHKAVNETMLALGFQWDVDREWWYNPDNVNMYQKAAANHVARINALLTEARIDELERTRLYDDMDDTDKHIEVERMILDRIAELKKEASE